MSNIFLDAFFGGYDPNQEPFWFIPDGEFRTGAKNFGLPNEILYFHILFLIFYLANVIWIVCKPAADKASIDISDHSLVISGWRRSRFGIFLSSIWWLCVIDVLYTVLFATFTKVQMYRSCVSSITQVLFLKFTMMLFFYFLCRMYGYNRKIMDAYMKPTKLEEARFVTITENLSFWDAFIKFDLLCSVSEVNVDDTFRYFDFMNVRFFWNGSRFQHYSRSTFGVEGLDSKQNEEIFQLVGPNSVSEPPRTWIEEVFNVLNDPHVVYLKLSVYLILGQKMFVYIHVHLTFGPDTDLFDTIPIQFMCLATIPLISLYVYFWKRTCKQPQEGIEEKYVSKYCDGRIGLSSVYQVVPGDRIVVHSNNVVPCDGVIVASNKSGGPSRQVIVTESMITGEPTHHPKIAISTNEIDVNTIASVHKVKSGSVVIQGQMELICTHTGGQSSRGKLLQADANKPSVVRMEFLAALKLTIFVFVFMSWAKKLIMDPPEDKSAYTQFIWKVFKDGTPFLQLIMEMELGYQLCKFGAYRWLKRKGVLTQRIEDLPCPSRVDTLVFDKTGTLTEEDLELAVVHLASETEFNKPNYVDDDLWSAKLPKDILAGMSASLMLHMQQGFIGHPMETAIARSLPPGMAGASVQKHYPFSSDDKTSGCIIEVDEAQHVFMKGAVESMLEVMDPESLPEDVEGVANKYANKGYTVLAFAHKIIQKTSHKVKRRSIGGRLFGYQGSVGGSFNTQSDAVRRSSGPLMDVTNQRRSSVCSNKSVTARSTRSNSAPSLSLMAAAQRLSKVFRKRSQSVVSTRENLVNMRKMYNYADAFDPFPSRDDAKCELQFCGLLVFRNALRKESKETISLLQDSASCIMCTGDHILSSLAIAKELGMVQDALVFEDDRYILNGQEMKLNEVCASALPIAISEPQYTLHKIPQELLHRIKIVARAKPDDKAALVKKLQAAGCNVAMIGNGFNDCRAFLAADVSIIISKEELWHMGTFRIESSLLRIVDIFRAAKACVVNQTNIFRFFCCLIFVMLVCAMQWTRVAYERQDFPNPDESVDEALRAMDFIWVYVLAFNAPAKMTSLRPMELWSRENLAKILITALWCFTWLITFIYLIHQTAWFDSLKDPEHAYSSMFFPEPPTKWDVGFMMIPKFLNSLKAAIILSFLMYNTRFLRSIFNNKVASTIALFFIVAAGSVIWSRNGPINKITKLNVDSSVTCLRSGPQMAEWYRALGDDFQPKPYRLDGRCLPIKQEALHKYDIVDAIPAPTLRGNIPAPQEPRKSEDKQTFVYPRGVCEGANTCLNFEMQVIWTTFLVGLSSGVLIGRKFLHPHLLRYLY